MLGEEMATILMIPVGPITTLGAVAICVGI
jgi:hypothetical protein